MFTPLILPVLFLALVQPLFASNDAGIMERLAGHMDETLKPLKKKEAWPDFIREHQALFGSVSEKTPDPFLAVTDLTFDAEKSQYRIGMGCRSIWIAATPKVVVEVVNNPHLFKELYGLDKPADDFPIKPDGSFDAHIFKLVPGIETQDYILNYTGGWDGDTWIQQAKLVRDDRSFALRNNIKIVEPSGNGTLFREVSLLYPRRWWVRLMHGIAQNIFKKELGKLNRSLKCAAEKVQKGAIMNDTLATQCYKESQK